MATKRVKPAKDNAGTKSEAKPVVNAESKPLDNGVVCAILCYFLVGIIWYFADENMKKNELARYHAKQGLVLLIASIAVSILFGIIWAIFVFIPMLWFLITAISWIVWLFFFVVWIFGIVYAATGKLKPMPIIGKFGEKFKF